MFWSGNYIAVRELNSLLKEENVSLTQVLEADDILQECKADNKALIQFLTKPEILAELITLITEEPPKNVELTSQYRHASIACEVLTSQLSTLSDRLSLDTVQMNRLCDFINQEPPLNPLLASYFSKTVEMLLQRSPKQDWYLYHIVCIRVLDFFKSRRDFLPNLLRHLATSAIADTFKYFLCLGDLFNKTVMEWLDEHQFLECLIQIICGTYAPEPLRPREPPAPAPAPAPAPPAPSAPAPAPADAPEKADNESSEKPLANHKPVTENNNYAKPSGGRVEANGTGGGGEQTGPGEAGRGRGRGRGEVAAANAASLLCDLVLNVCAPDGCTTRARTVCGVVQRLQSERWVRALLGAAFTSPPAARPAALAHCARVLLALLSADPILEGESAMERTCVELAVAPHLPLLHQALLHRPPYNNHNHNDRCAEGREGAAGAGAGAGGGGAARVGAARVQTAALLAHLALSEVPEVPTTILTLDTPGVLLELFFRHAENNFLHAQVYAFVKHALRNRAYRLHYAKHIILECDLLTRLMDVYEENESKERRGPRAGYMGHVVLLLRRVWGALDELEGELVLPPPLAQRWAAFLADTLRPLAHHHDTPLGGYYPSDNIYEVSMAELAEGLEATYEFNDVGGSLDDINIDCIPEGNEETDADGNDAGEDKVSMLGAKNAFLELASQRFDDDMWDDAEAPELAESLGVCERALHDVTDVLDLAAPAPWEVASTEAGASEGEAWAQFGAVCKVPPPVDPYAPLLASYCVPPPPPPPRLHHTDESSNETTELEDEMAKLRLYSAGLEAESDPARGELAQHLLSAMSRVPEHVVAGLVSAHAPSPTHAGAGSDIPHSVTVSTNTTSVPVSTADISTSPAPQKETATVSSGPDVSATTDQCTDPSADQSAPSTDQSAPSTDQSADSCVAADADSGAGTDS